MSKVKLKKWEIEFKELEDKYYPIHWYVEDNDIKMFDKNNVELPQNHKVYQNEVEFVCQQIRERMTFEDEICCP